MRRFYSIGYEICIDHYVASVIKICTLLLFLNSTASEFLFASEVTTDTCNNVIKNVSVLWFPRYPHHLSVTHSKFAMDDQVYTNGKKNGSLSRLQERAATSKALGFYQFDLNLNSKETVGTEKFLDALPRRTQTCIGGVCKPLMKGGVYIPPLARNLPSMNALYWFTLYKLGSSRVKNINYYGREGVTKILSPDLVMEVATYTNLGVMPYYLSDFHPQFPFTLVPYVGGTLIAAYAGDIAVRLIKNKERWQFGQSK